MENLKTKKSFIMIMVIVAGLALLVGVVAILFNLQSGDTAQIVGKLDVNAKKATLSESGGVALTQDGVTALLESLTSEIETLTTKVNNLESNGSSVLDAYPVGSIYISTSSTNPGTLFGGTWEAYGQGRTLVGVGTGTDSNSTSQTFAAGATGGAYNHTLTTAQLPKHTHSISGVVTGTGTTTATYVRAWHKVYKTYTYTTSGEMDYWYTSGGEGDPEWKGIELTQRTVLTSATSSNKTSGETGSGTAHNNIQPYIATYMWKRTS